MVPRQSEISRQPVWCLNPSFRVDPGHAMHDTASRNTMKKHTQHRIEYLAVRSLGGLFRNLPHSVAMSLGCGIARYLYHVARFRVVEAKRRIRIVFKDTLSQQEVNRIARLSLRNVVLGGVEMMRLSKLKRDWLFSVCDLEGVDTKLRPHADTQKGAIMAMPHTGSWEITALVGHELGFAVFAVGAEQKNKLVMEYIERLRGQTGAPRINRGKGTMREVLRRLKAGGTLGIMPDLRVPTGGIDVDFFGGTATVGPGTAIFAKQTGVPIFPTISLRQGTVRHRIEVLDPIWPDPSVEKKEDIRRMTQDTLTVIDGVIRKHPEQWFWYNKRWILDPIKKD